MELGCIGVPFEIKFAGDDAPVGSFEGYGAVFGNIDSHGDVIEPGAFAKTLLDRERAGRALPPMRKMHGLNSLDPIGVWEKMSEDANGLYVKGRLVGLDTEAGKFTYAQLREGALKGLSIGYKVPPHGAKMGSGKTGEPRRYLKSVNLNEVSLVDDPSNAYARAYSVKSADESAADEIKTIREFEDFLRDVGGFSHAAAKAIAAGGFKAHVDPRDEDTKSAVDEAVEGIVKAIRGF